MFSRIKPSALATIVCLAASSVAYCQVSTATVTGVVQDNTGAIIPGADVVLTQTQTNTTARAVTSERGAFTLPALPVGPYAMAVTFPNFAKYERTGIVLTVGQVANIDVQLTVGATDQTITVNTGAPLINPTDPTISNTIDEKTVEGLPLNGRNPADLVFNVAGVSNTGENTGTGQLASTNQINPPNVTVPNSSAPAVNGVRAGGTFFSLDGAVNVDPLSVIGGPFPDPDATQEFQVVTGTFGSRYISAPGGAVNIVSRAGTNQIHGTVFEFIRNGYVNAENAIFAQPDTLKRNQYGATIGGPVLRDRLFFFASYQGTRIASKTINSYIVPSAAERNGIFTACPVTAASCTASNSMQLPLTSLPPIFASFGVFNVPSAVNANFFNYKGSGNALIPLPNGPNNQLTVGVPYHQNGNQFVGRLDYRTSASHSDFVRYYSDRFNTPAVGQSTTAPYNLLNTSSGQQQNWDTAAVGDTWTPTQHLVLETRLSFLNVLANQTAPSSANFINYPGLGANNYSEPNPAGPGITVIGSNLIPPDSAGNFKRPRTNLTVSEDVIYSRGRHEVTVGGDLQYIHNGNQNPAGQDGVIIYAGVFSKILTNALGLQIQDYQFADFYFGHPIVFVQGDGFFSSNHGYVPGVYAQDKFRVTDRLTATFGARYDPFVPYKVENSQISCYRAGQKSSVYTGAPTGLVFPGDPNCPTGGVNGQYNIVQPRVGVAYQLNQKGTQAIRAGYGLYNIQVPLSALGGFQAFPYTRQFIFTNPFQDVANLYASNGATNPFATGFNGFGYKPASNVTFPTNPPSNAANFGSNFRPGYVQQYSLSYQFSVGNNDSLELAFVGTKGTHLAQNFDNNEPVFIPGVSTGVAGSCGSLTGANLPSKGTACSSTGNEQVRRPNAGIAILSTESPIGYSNYAGGQVTYNHRLTHGFDINSNFTSSKCIDNGSNPGSTGANVAGNIDLDPSNPAFSRGRCDFDQPFNFRNTVIYTAPKLAGNGFLLRNAVGGWQVSGRFIFDSGQPFSVSTESSDNSYTGTNVDRADIVAGQPVYSNGRLNYAAFRLNAAGTLGNSGRNAYRTAANDQVDNALMKTFALTDRYGLMFRAEAFNVINHPNYYAPVNNLDTSTAATFDTYQQARDPRQLQFAFKFIY